MKNKLFWVLAVCLLTAAACGRGLTSHERMMDGMEGKLTLEEAVSKWGSPHSSYEHDKYIIAKWYMDPSIEAEADCQKTLTYICYRRWRIFELYFDRKTRKLDKYRGGWIPGVGTEKEIMGSMFAEPGRCKACWDNYSCRRGIEDGCERMGQGSPSRYK